MKVIVITGASRGLGQVLAKALRGPRRKVIGLARMPAAQLAPDDLRALDGYHQVDLQDAHAVDQACAAILAQHGRIDVLINNAALRAFKPFQQFEAAEITQNIAANFTAPALLASRVLPGMLERGYGRIIDIAAWSGAPGAKSATLYASTKSALLAFSQSLALDLAATGKNVTANAICPGAFQARDGEKYPAHDYIVSRVAMAVDRFIEGRRNGAVLVIDTPRQRLRKFLRHVRSGLSMLGS